MSEQQTTHGEAMSQPLAPYLPEEENQKRSCIFYKLIVPSILQDKKLRIPDKFVKKFGDELSTVAKLTIPSGRLWLVELRKLNKKLWFDIGWHEFVEHCSIRAGYFMIFRYQGNSDFNVYIYDLAKSEIEYPFNTCSSLEEEPSGNKQCSVPIDKDKGEDNSFGISKPSSSPCPVLSPSTINVEDEGAYYKKNKNSTSGVKLKYLHLAEEVHNQEATFQSPQDKGIIQFKSNVTNKSDEVGLYFSGGTKRKISGPGQITDSCKHKLEPVELPKGRTSCKTYTRRGRALTSEEKKSALRAAEIFKSNNPFFKVVLRPSYVYKSLLLHIPSIFARTYLNGIKGDVTLTGPNGKQWRVRCISQNGKAKFGQGWSEFVWDNNLDESDVCVFELVKTDDVTLKVTIFRVLQDARSEECQPSK
ncbi:B3 domain-containing transcription factor VRN1 [Citrus sinensis]|uniref:B3 domain-containing transcription factor VRN1-like isoform X1 n=1 Tax=Citrus sinensis TaxID=2711 RepID=UPI00218F168E|nr:B3 domain-containing transcription factor VRN1-like isoform X1 [Citrus sinensis]KAH9656326.1 B3 domain-containing transcription factor VRN1 [Citrus sinensis]